MSASRAIPSARPRRERGAALVLAMFVLLVLSMLGMELASMVVMNRRQAGTQSDAQRALDAAEAGVSEMLSRLAATDIVLDATRPRAASMVFLTSGSLPTVGTDTTARRTAQVSGAWQPYSTAGRSADVLTMSFKTDAAGSVLYRYDPRRVPSVNTVSGSPVYVVRSTGRVGGARRKLYVEVAASTPNLSLRGAITTGQPVTVSSNAVVCGYDHVASTPDRTGSGGRTGGCDAYETGPTPLPGVWTTGTLAVNNAGEVDGSPVNSASGQSGFYAGPWEPLQMSAPAFTTYVGTPVRSLTTLDGINYLDNDATLGNQSGSFSISGGTGSGFLYVDGDLVITGNFSFKGLIYVEGDLDTRGRTWVLGAVIVRGRSSITIKSNTTVLQSSEAVQQALTRADQGYRTIAWREVP